MRFERMTSRLSAGRTTGLCYGPQGLPEIYLISYPIRVFIGCEWQGGQDNAIGLGVKKYVSERIWDHGTTLSPRE